MLECRFKFKVNIFLKKSNRFFLFLTKRNRRFKSLPKFIRRSYACEYGKEMIVSRRRESPCYLIVKLNCFAYEFLYIANKSSSKLL